MCAGFLGLQRVTTHLHIRACLHPVYRLPGLFAFSRVSILSPHPAGANTVSTIVIPSRALPVVLQVEITLSVSKKLGGEARSALVIVVVVVVVVVGSSSSVRRRSKPSCGRAREGHAAQRGRAHGHGVRRGGAGAGRTGRAARACDVPFGHRRRKRARHAKDRLGCEESERCVCHLLNGRQRAVRDSSLRAAETRAGRAQGGGIHGSGGTKRTRANGAGALAQGLSRGGAASRGARHLPREWGSSQREDSQGRAWSDSTRTRRANPRARPRRPCARAPPRRRNRAAPAVRREKRS